MTKPFFRLAFAIMLAAAAATANADERHVSDSAADAKPLEVGQSTPNARLLTADSKEIALRDVTAGKPTVIVFFRGAWCPFCTRHLASLSSVLPKLKERGYQVIAISPDTPEAMKKIEGPADVAYYSDPLIEAASRYGLAFRLDEKTSQRYKGFGIKIQPIDGIAGDILPVPAVFILNDKGEIVFAHANADYRKRLSADEILEAAK